MAPACIPFALTLLLASKNQIPLADLSVREIRSSRVDGKVFRAVKGYSEVYPFLVVELIELGQDEAQAPAVTGAWALRDMEGWKIEAPMEGDEIGELKWRGSDLEFLYLGVRGVLACSISRIEVKKPRVICRERTGKATKHLGR